MNTPYLDPSAALLITVLERQKTAAAIKTARNAGAPGGTVLMGLGTAENKWLRLLGLDDVEKELLYTILPSSLVPAVVTALKTTPSLAGSRGIMFTINILRAFRSAQPSLFAFQETLMPNARTNKPEYELISVIVNSGNADAVMDAARSAGATGGTIVHARGTARPEDTPFFGITIVPEKELVMILASTEKSSLIMESIKAQFIHAEPGTGIAFCTAVESFHTLGKR